MLWSGGELDQRAFDATQLVRSEDGRLLLAAPQLGLTHGADALGSWLCCGFEPSWLSRSAQGLIGGRAVVPGPLGPAKDYAKSVSPTPLRATAPLTPLPSSNQAIDEDGSGFISESELTEALMQASGLVDGVSRSEVSKYVW